ncbi:VanZ family protein [Paenibacillus rhizoplanae]|uniref:VanZ family protein n=1 Tax=Paenibacillus rhizoplanae TaxID=1917181 RepID=A0ABW5FFP5_9BACL
MADLMGYFIIGGILIVAVMVLYLPFFFLLRGRVSTGRQLCLIFFTGSCLIMLYATIFSAWGADAFHPKEHHLNVIPFIALGDSEGMSEDKMIVQAVANIIMFIPYGFFLPMVFTRLRSFSRTAFAVFATSFSIEFIQYFLGATADIDDIILNFVGGILGYTLYATVFRYLLHHRRTLRDRQ